jgi:hypothetical protein
MTDFIPEFKTRFEYEA